MWLTEEKMEMKHSIKAKDLKIRIRKKCDRTKQIIVFFCSFLVRFEKLKFDGKIFVSENTDHQNAKQIKMKVVKYMHV